jgi:uroporphyrinogen decarboxylase
MMRQAGRYLPEFIALRDKYDFFHPLSNARISCGNYSSTIRRIAPDAAILFSDILVIPRHGIEVEMKPNFGPYLPNPIRTIQDVEKVIVPDVHETLGYVFDAIKLTKEMLNDEVPLIGFAGSPWTIMCYAVEGSKSFDMAKVFLTSRSSTCFIAKNYRYYNCIPKEKVKAGVNVKFLTLGRNVVSSGLSRILWKYINQIIEALADVTPVIVLEKDVGLL